MLRVIPSVLWLAFCASVHAAEPAGLSVSVKDFGAIGDGVTMNTNAIQQAIDSVANKGGGVVHVPAGKYLIGISISKRTPFCWEARARRTTLPWAISATGLE